MSFIAQLQRAREILAQKRWLSTRALARELEIRGDDLDEIIEELVAVLQASRTTSVRPPSPAAPEDACAR